MSIAPCLKAASLPTPTARHPEGKLRLMYEANPMAFLIEQAGGRGDTGEGPILDIKPTHVHQGFP